MSHQDPVVPVDEPMSLSEHLDALRTHLLRGGKWVLVGFCVCFFFSEHLVDAVTWPHQKTMAELGLPSNLFNFSYQETFVVHLKLALFAGLFLGMPLLLREIWSFGEGQGASPPTPGRPTGWRGATRCTTTATPPEFGRSPRAESSSGR